MVKTHALGPAFALAALAAIAAACHPPARPVAAPPPGDDITLYRDLALVRQRLELDVPATPTTLPVEVAAGVTAEGVLLLDRGGLTITGIHGGQSDAPARDGRTVLRLDVSAPHPGRYTVVISYLTDRLPWKAAYTMTTTPARDRADLRGAISIRNTTGLELRRVALRLVDAELGSWRGRRAARLARRLVGGKPSGATPAVPLELGTIALGAGESWIALLPHAAPRSMRAVLLYDPIGTHLDSPGDVPQRDPALGVDPPAPSRVAESLEIQRDPIADAGLPAGTVRLMERRADGSLGVLGEARLFEATARSAKVDTITIGTAAGVTGHRERRELTIDDERHRLVEEFEIALDNKRPRPVAVRIREHLYRGQSWTMAYTSVPTAEKEGPQQIALRTVVPAASQMKLLYVVVYTWER